MNPKKKLPDDSQVLVEIGRYMLVQQPMKNGPYYQIYEFYEGDDGRRYWPRGAGDNDLEAVKSEMMRITGKKIK